MEDSDGSEVEFTVIGQSFQLLQDLSEVETEQERTKLIRDHIGIVEKEDVEACPDFEEGLEWFNVRSALSMENDLRGKLVVLDFFTYCCINCMHILPDLHRLEQDFSLADGLVVVGVHSAKFDNEKVSANILSAVLRYDITHPVVNDCEAKMWHAMEISCWPTLVVVSPQGRPLLHLMGEGNLDVLRDFVKVALSHYQDRGEINPKQDIAVELSKDSLPQSPLHFPGKIAVEPSGQRLAIADTGHHRILVTDLNGVVQNMIGSGDVGFKDGKLVDAKFNAPQGITWKNNTIYIADTENHAIRSACLTSGLVTTIAGTGKQGHDREGGNPGLQQPISSPWDVVLTSAVGSDRKDVLMIAMAGTHQIWLYFLEDGKWLKGKSYTKDTCVRFAGNGAEENRNNSYPHAAAFAQPSGLALRDHQHNENMLFVADSESSSIRQISLTDGAVKAVVGATRDPRNLFAFGDKDGKGIDVKLQHPIGVAMEPGPEGRLLVADSYNHKIKTVNTTKKECHTLLGSGKVGDHVSTDASAVQLNEPGGLSVHPKTGNVYIADTNNHSIKVFHPNTAATTQLTILLPTKATPDNTNTEVEDEVDAAPVKKPYKRLVPKSAEVCNNTAVQGVPGSSVNLKLNIQLSEGLHPTEGAPLKWQISMQDAEYSSEVLADVHIQQGETMDYSNQPAFKVHIPTQTGSEPVMVDVEVISYYCDDFGACRMKGLLFHVPLEIAKDSATNKKTHLLNYTLKVP